MTDQTGIAVIPKNRSSEIRVSLVKYMGINLVDVRIFSSFDNGEKRPTKQGVAVSITRLPALADALTLALTEARRLGLFDEKAAA